MEKIVSLQKRQNNVEEKLLRIPLTSIPVKADNSKEELAQLAKKVVDQKDYFKKKIKKLKCRILTNDVIIDGKINTLKSVINKTLEANMTLSQKELEAQKMIDLIMKKK